MNKLVNKFLLISVFSALYSSVSAQTNPDDYWLNNGFSSGQTIFTNSGFFYDDGGNDLYQTGQNWSVRFCSENGNPITFDFNGFRTYYNGGSYSSWDYMRITYNGFPTLVAYDYDTPQFSFTAPDGCIRFDFISQAGGVSIPDSGWVAEISAIPPPVNNDPCDAIDLSVGNVCSPVYGSNKGAWDTRNLGKPSCHPFFGGDVWFSAVVPPSGSVKVETLAGSLKYAIMVLYRGDCSSLAEYDCVDNPGVMPGRTFTGLIPGEKVLIRIYGDQAKSGTFGICATDPAAEITGFTGPGGVGDAISNRLWLKADSGPVDASLNQALEGGSVHTWLDRSGNDNHTTQLSTSAQPTFRSAGLNNLETVSFDGTQTNMRSSLGVLSAPVSIFSVQDFAISKDQTVLAAGNASEITTFSIARENISNQYYTYTSDKQYGAVLPDDPHFIFARYLINSPFHTYKLNGTSQTVAYTQGQASSNGEFYLGSDKNLARFMDGNISEVIIYSKVLNEAQEIIVSNYLAAKYSFTIADDYFEFQDTHPFELAGIGRVSEGNSHSRAQSAGILSLGGASALGDNEFVLFAHDGAGLESWTSADTPSEDTEMLRLPVEWIVDITGDGPGDLSIILDTTLLPALPEDYLAYNIMVDADGDFSSGAVTYGLIPSGSELIANNVALTDGSFIAISAVKSVISFELGASSGLESIERPRIGVVLSNAVSGPVSVNYTIIAGTAEKGVDYSLNDGTLIFDPGEKFKEIIPLIFEDAIVEVPDEFFTIELSEPTGGVTLGDTVQHTYTILGNDLSLSISASDTLIGACSGSVTTLSAIAAGAEPITFSWTPMDGLNDPLSSTTIANPSETTMYTVTATDAVGNTIKDSLQITVAPSPLKPEIFISGVTEFCAGENVGLEGPAGFLYNWSNGETLQSIFIEQSDTLYLIITDTFGCSSEPSDSVFIIVNPMPSRPEITYDNDLQFCLDDSIRLYAPEGYSDYSWSNGATGPFISVKETGSYSVVVTDSKGCTSEPSEGVSVLVSEKPPKPVITYDGDPEFCSGNNLDLSGPSGYSYLWSDGSDTQDIIVDQGGNYTLVIYNGGCASEISDPVIVTENPVPAKPEITPAGPHQLMKGESIELSSSDADEYLWSTGATTKSITAAETGDYSVTVFSLKGCESPVSDIVSVTVVDKYPAPIVTITGDTSFCEGGNVTLSSAEAFAYEWSNGETTKGITLTESGSFYVVTRDENGMESQPSDPVSVQVHPNPVITASVDHVSCYNGSDASIQLLVEEGELPYEVDWTGGLQGLNPAGIPAGAYVAVVTDANECSAQLDIAIDQPEDISISGEVQSAYCPDAADGEISISVIGGTPSYDLNWNTGATGDLLLNIPAGSYTLTVKDFNNCLKTANFTVENLNELCFVIPDIITPNGDGKNDEWQIEGLQFYPDVTVEIFDRWGKRVFYSKGYDQNFDGNFNGKELPMESYHYIINLNDNSPVIIGNITIVR